jgi:hypothetical protein
MNLLQLVLTAGVFAVLAVVVWAAVLLRTVRDGVREILELLRCTLAPPCFYHPSHTYFDHIHLSKKSRYPGGSATWEWRGGRWHLISTDLPAGADPGPPPPYPGGLEGEVVKTWVTPRRH